MKDFIRDNGKVRNCYANIAKMNAWEYWWYVTRKDFRRQVRDLFVGLWEGLSMTLVYVPTVALFPLVYPVLVWINARRAIKRAKASMPPQVTA